MGQNQRLTIDISIRTIMKFFGVVLLLAFLYYIKDILILLFLTLVIVAALNPIVDKWGKEIPRKVAVALLYFIIFLALAAAGLLILQPLVDQIQQIAHQLPSFLKFVNPTLREVASESQRTLFSLSQQLSSIGLNILSTTIGVIGGLVAAITVVVISFYLLMEQGGAKKFFLSIVPSERKEEFVEVISKIGDKMGAWLRGQLSLMVIVGILYFIGLLLIGVPFPLALAVLGGLLEIIPYAGPLVAGVVAVLLAFTVSPLTAILTIILFVVVQQLESQFLVPKVMQKAVGLNPVIVIIALLIGGRLAGILGIILAVPAAAVIEVLLDEYPMIKRVLAKD